MDICAYVVDRGPFTYIGVVGRVKWGQVRYGSTD